MAQSPEIHHVDEQTMQINYCYYYYYYVFMCFVSLSRFRLAPEIPVMNAPLKFQNPSKRLGMTVDNLHLHPSLPGIQALLPLFIKFFCFFFMPLPSFAVTLSREVDVAIF